MFLELSKKIKALVDGTSDILRIVDSFENWDSKSKIDFINYSFNNIIKYAYKEIPYYHKTFIDHGIRMADIQSISDITKIPVLTKDIIRSNYDYLKPNRINSIKHIKRRSGGTTGEPILSLISNEARAYETFSFFKGLRWMGWHPTMTTVKLLGGSLGSKNRVTFREWVYEKSMKTISTSAFKLDKNNIVSFYDKIKNEKSLCLIGYASAINNMIQLLKESSLILNNIDLVITTSEQLIQDWKINISDYANCPIRSFFGCGEVESLGYQEYGKADEYRIPIEHVFLESDKNQNLLITQLHNRAQPLLRYANGDICDIENKVGNEYISILIGRTADYFIRKDGTKVSPIFGTHSILVSGVPVKKYQYVQYNNNIIEFRYITENGIFKEEHKTKLKNIVDFAMDEKTELVFTETSNFEINSSMKHRICVRLEKPFESND